jgi:hypothetical protein
MGQGQVGRNATNAAPIVTSTAVLLMTLCGTYWDTACYSEQGFLDPEHTGLDTEEARAAVFGVSIDESQARS